MERKLPPLNMNLLDCWSEGETDPSHRPPVARERRLRPSGGMGRSRQRSLSRGELEACGGEHELEACRDAILSRSLRPRQRNAAGGTQMCCQWGRNMGVTLWVVGRDRAW